LALISLQLLTFNHAGLVLILLGIALLVGEAFMPSFGVLGIGGVISLALGSFLLFDTQDSTIGVDPAIIFTAVATMTSFVLAISYLVYRSQRAKPTLGLDGMLGEIGDVRAKLSPVGKVFVRGELWNAEADGEIDLGEKVEIVGYQGMNLKVRRLTKQST
jgi:membrane-bound serine protease (ClpP class)